MGQGVGSREQGAGILICVNASTCFTHPCATAQQHCEICDDGQFEIKRNTIYSFYPERTPYTPKTHFVFSLNTIVSVLNIIIRFSLKSI